MNRLLAVLALLVWAGLLAAGCGGSQRATAPDDAPDASDVVVARYAGTPITLAEFETRYRRSASDSTQPASDSMGAYVDFLDRYVNFRLKVKAARDAGMDTLASIREEVASYRDQMARPSLLEDEVIRPVARTLYERKQKEVDVSHILIRVGPDAPPSDTVAAFRKMQSLADSLDGGADFGALALSESQDPSAQQEGRRGYRGDLGTLTAGQIVKPFEDEMYETPVGEVSDVFRTRFGYHVLKVHDRRERPDPLTISHILIRPEGRTPADSAAARREADSLRVLAESGAPFDSLARTNSDDPQSAARGGELGTIQPGQPLPDAFRAALDSLNEEGEISDVVETRFGYHVLRLDDRVEPESFEASFEDLKREVSQLPRLDEQQAAFARRVLRERGTTVDTAAVLRAAESPSPDSIARPLLPIAGRDSVAGQTFATMGDSTFTLGQLSRHVVRTEGGPRMSIAEAIGDFLREKAIGDAAARLEERDPEFAQLMTEYREGLLLFQYMQDSVWTVAAQDTAALRETYRANRESYRFPERVRTLLLRAPSDTLLAPYDASYDDGTPLADVIADAAADSLVRVDTTMITEDASDPYASLWNASDGTVRGPLDEGGDRVLMIRDTQLPARAKTFGEARSAVVRDYQDAFEDEVEARLRERYSAETYPDRLQWAFYDERGSAPTPAAAP